MFVIQGFCLVFASFLFHVKRLRPALLGSLVFLTWISALTGHSIFKAVGDTVVLMSDPVDDPITSVTWQIGPDIAAEFYRGNSVCYRDYEGRCMLNSSTGALTITGLTHDDSGVYTAQINNQFTNRTQLSVISPVSKPTVSTWCDPEKAYCLLTCEGNTTDAEPIAHKWRAGDVEIGFETKVINITKEQKEPSFSCELSNLVSCESSDAVPNPFSIRNRIWVWIIPCVILLLFVLFFICKSRKGTDGAGTVEENSSMLPSGHAETQIQDHVVSLEPNNVHVTAAPEMTAVLSNGHTEAQIQDHVVLLEPNNVHVTVIPEVRETSTQDSTSPVSTHTSSQTGERSSGPEAPDQEPPAAEQEKDPRAES